MQMTIYNIAKQRLETIDIEITKENTTWFDDIVDLHSVLSITDFQDGLLIKQCDYSGHSALFGNNFPNLIPWLFFL